MLYPKANNYRRLVDLCGIWQFKMDPKSVGVKMSWHNKCSDTVDIGVPGSWNDQLRNMPEAKDYVGDAWYYLNFNCPQEWQDQLVWIWFGAVNYRATVWLNGRRLGHHEGGYMPFKFVINNSVNWEGENLLAVKVNNILGLTTLPPLQPPEKRVTATSYDFQHQPPVSYDFFPFAGIHRAVRLITTPRVNIDDITVVTDIKGKSGIVNVQVDTNRQINSPATILITGFNKSYQQEIKIKAGQGRVKITIPQCKLWSPQTPNLYNLKVALHGKDGIIDEYVLDIGVRTVKVQGNKLLLNGKPIYLKGFGKHEDFHIVGKGVVYPLLVNDFELLDWINANSFRTSHYPYADEIYDLADRRGTMIIDECAGVAISAYAPLKGLLKTHRKQMAELYQRDKNHPSVIMWSVANEPTSWERKMVPYFKTVLNDLRKLDKTRPITMVLCSQPDTEKVIQMFDILSINRYWGQARFIGRLEEAEKSLHKNLDGFYKRFKMPIFFSEFGAECIAGFHGEPPEIWSEEYQQAVIQMDIRVIRSKHYSIGEHVWNFAEFKTAQEIIKTMYNRKGVFTRDRRPKMAAHWLREFWSKDGKVIPRPNK